MGLQEFWESVYKKWAKDTSWTFGASDKTWLRLRAASLIAGISADHNAWRSTAGILAERMVMTADAGPDREYVTNALSLLRQTGDQKSVELAVRHLLRNGPAGPVIDDVNVIDLERSTSTSVRADLAALQSAADVLVADRSDRHIAFLLEVLRDPTSFGERVKATFWVSRAVLETMSDLLLSASKESVRDIVDHVISLPQMDDQLMAHHYAGLIREIPEDAWIGSDLVALEQRGETDNFELAEAISEVLAKCDPSVRDALRTRIADGDIASLQAFGDVRDLGQETAAGLIANLASKVANDIEELGRGQYSHRSVNYAGVLVLINACYPDQADWDPVLELLMLKSLYSQQLTAPLESFRKLGGLIPEPVVMRIIPVLRSLVINPPSQDPFFGPVVDVVGAAAAALAAVRPNELGDSELAHFLTGSEDRRVAAVRVIAARERPADLTALAVLSKDPSVDVRAQVAFGLAQWIGKGITDQRVLDLLTHVLDDGERSSQKQWRDHLNR